MTLQQKRCIFTKYLFRMGVWFEEEARLRGKNWQLAIDEANVSHTDAADGDHDGPHLEGGTHYSGTGCDILVYDNGVYIAVKHTAYEIMGAWWKGLNINYPDLQFVWGGDFAKKDYNHFSIKHAGKS